MSLAAVLLSGCYPSSGSEDDTGDTGMFDTGAPDSADEGTDGAVEIYEHCDDRNPVLFMDTQGTVTVLDDLHDFFSSEAPAAVTITESGAVHFCEPAEGGGPRRYVNLVVEGYIEVTIEGEGDELTFLDGGGVGPIVIARDGSEVSILRLSATNGRGVGANEGDTGTSCGGAISITDSYVTLGGVSVSDSRASDGGGICAKNSYLWGDVYVWDSTASVGGGIYTNNATVSLSATLRGNVAGWGGGWYSEDSDIQIEQLSLSQNVGEEGGGLMMQDSVMVAYDVDISGNTAEFGGGGVLVEEGGYLVALSGSIEHNEADGGGGVIISEDSRAYFQDISFYSNEAKDIGGAILLYGDGSVSGNGCTFQSNTPHDLSSFDENFSVVLDNYVPFGY